MISLDSSFEKKLTTFFQTFKVLGIAKLLCQFLHSKRKDQIASKNTYYRFLNNNTFNWCRFLLSLVAKITANFSKLTNSKRGKVFILDDSIVTRNRSKSVELMSRVYDHVTHKYQKGFTMLTLGLQVRQ